MPSNDFEHGEAEAFVEEVRFDSLELGDALELLTASGSNYRLTVAEIDDRGKRLANLERSSSHSVQGETVDSPDLVGLRGSCRPHVAEQHTIMSLIADGDEGWFRVGERAWLDICKEDDKALITTEVQEIKISKLRD
jgi:hypothetical protein